MAGVICDWRSTPQHIKACRAVHDMVLSCACGAVQAYKDSGDTASKKGDRIWIAEMYGYSFGAAKTNVWHKWHHDFMLYPSYTPSCETHTACVANVQLLLWLAAWTMHRALATRVQWRSPDLVHRAFSSVRMLVWQQPALTHGA